MVDFNVEVSFSGSGVLPGEAMRLGRAMGFKCLGLVLRADQCSYRYELPKLLSSVKEASLYGGVDALVGVKFVQAPSSVLSDAIAEARELGAQLILVQGEGCAESFSQVERGLNFSAINAGADILARPGLLTSEDAKLAAEKNVVLELTAVSPYSLFNGRVARMAKEHSLDLTISCGLFTRQLFFSKEEASNLWKSVAFGSGLEKEDVATIQSRSIKRFQNLFK